MLIFDLVLLLIILIFGWRGLRQGIVATVVSLLGTILAIYLAVRFYAPMADWLIGLTGWGENFSKVVMFIIAFVLINRLVVGIFWILQKFLRLFTGLPIIRLLDRLLGLLFGLLEGGLILGILFYFIARFPLGDTFMGWISASLVVPYLTLMAGILLPLIPDALRMIRSTLE